MARVFLLLAIALLLFTTGAAMAETINSNITEGGWDKLGNGAWTLNATIELNQPLADYKGDWEIAAIAKEVYDDEGNLCKNVSITKIGKLTPTNSSTRIYFQAKWNKCLSPNWDFLEGIASLTISRQKIKVNVID